MNKLFTKSEESQLLDDAINSVLTTMKEKESFDDEYNNMVKTLDSLVEVRNKQKRKFISKESAPLVANLVGIAMILYHEKAHVITSKAVGFITKGRV